MNRSINFSLISLLVIFMLSGCAQRGNYNPLGVTGGSDDGYGKSRDLSQTGSSSYDSHDSANLVGTWRYDESMNEYSLWTFKANGTFVMELYEDGILEYTIDGTYSTSDNTLTIYLNGEPFTFIYSISGNQLTLSDNGDSSTLYRV